MTRQSIRRFFSHTALRLLAAGMLLAALPGRAADMARPWTFWYWMYGAVSKAGIRADLQSMKDAGLGGCYLMPIRGAADRPDYGGRAEQLTPVFWDMADEAFRIADSLNLEMGIHICDGFALAGGPWITPEESMQRVVWSDTIVSASCRDALFLAPPTGEQGYYQDIAVCAVPVPERNATADYRVIAPEGPAEDGAPYIGRNEKGVFRADSACHILLDFGARRTVRSMCVIPSGGNIQSERLLVEVSDDACSYRTVRQLVPPRQGWQNTGFDFTYDLPVTSCRYVRLSWTPDGTEPGAEDLDAAKWRPNLKLKDVVFYTYSQTDLYEGKNGSVWRISPDDDLLKSAPSAGRGILKTSDIILLPLLQDGSVRLPASARKNGAAWYRILRMGHTSTGHTNATAGGGKGLECDKFSAHAVEKQVSNWFDKFMERPHHEVVKYMHIDSWECGSQNWNVGFAEEFRQRRGYDLLPFLPVYAGVPLENADKVLRDVRLTINDLINDVFFKTLHRLAAGRGVTLSSESVAPTMVSDGMAHYRHTDIPMGEFWLRSPTHDKPNDMLDAISGAHVYGKPIIQAEGFTEVRGTWDESPATVKTLLDLHFALGMNRLFFHVTAHNPWTDRRPGMTLDGIGLFFQRDQTWMPEAKALTDYVTRCQRLLQRGRPVVDVAVFTGEEMPSRAVLPERLLPMLPGLFGENRVRKELERVRNAGQPMAESPVGVRHAAGITGAADWVNALRGYQYDSMNPDALLDLAEVDGGGSLVLPGGARYRVLVLPENDAMNPSCRPSEKVISKVNAFRQAGGIVIDRPYRQEDFSGMGLPRDVLLPEGIAYTHRQDGKEDIYFLSNQTEEEKTFTCVLREKSPYLALYDAMTDRYARPENRLTDAGMNVVVRLAPRQSVFILQSSEPFADLNTAPLAPLTDVAAPLDCTPWQVSFTENGAGMTYNDLVSWTESADDAVRYYSGQAVYETAFRLKKRPTDRVWLTFSRIFDVAHVYVDGRDCGTLWTLPYQTDITDALKSGKRHTLRVVVTNTWANALSGQDTGHAPFEGIWTNASYRRKEKTLLPAGLTGPVQVIMERNDK